MAPTPFRFRMRYRKEGPAAYLGHLDLVDVLVRALRRAGALLAYSQGFHPMPRVEPGPPLPLGVEGRAEWLDLTFAQAPRGDLLSRFNGMLPRGLTAEELAPLRPTQQRLSEFTVQRYEVGLDGLGPAERDGLAGSVASFLAASSWPVTRRAKGGMKTLDLRPRVSRLEVRGEVLAVELSQGGFMDLLEALVPGGERERLRLARTEVGPPPEAPPPPARRLQDLEDAFESSGGRRP